MGLGDRLSRSTDIHRVGTTERAPTVSSLRHSGPFTNTAAEAFGGRDGVNWESEEAVEHEKVSEADMVMSTARLASLPFFLGGNGNC